MMSVQFVSVLSFMVVMPLGPDYTLALGIDPSQVGWVMASYALSSSLAGILAATVLDRFDRRPALGVCMTGLVLCNVATGLATSLETLMAARLLAGAFGGPAAALSIAVVADNVPPERRGQAVGRVSGALSVSSVVGIPLALELAHLSHWRMPFFAVAALGMVIVAVAIPLLGPQRGHMAAMGTPGGGGGVGAGLRRLARIAGRPLAPLAFLLSAAAIMPGFMVITNLAVFVQFNLGFPREDLGLLYMIGGTLSFFGMQWAGRLVDRYGATPVTFITAGVLLALTYVLYFDWALLALPILALVPAFMLFNTSRMVAQSTTVSKVPEPAERAGFMALVGSVTQFAGGMGALAGATILEVAPDGRLLHMPEAAALAMALTAVTPLLMWALERRLPAAAQPSARVKAASIGKDPPG